MNPDESTRKPFWNELAEELEKLHGKARKAREILLGSLSTEISTTPFEVVYREDR